MNIFKKTIVTTLFIVTGFLSTNAQTSNDHRQYVNYGIKGGLNLTNLRGIEGEIKTGFTVGIFAEYLMSTNFSLRTETNFSVQGAKSEVGNEKLKLNYINMPFLAKYYVFDAFSVEAGPQLGVLLSGKGGGLPESAYKTLDLGLGFGLGYHITEKLELGARYNFGLTDITKTTGDIKNSVFQCTLAYGF